MLKEKMLPVSILCLSVSIIISAAIISRGMKSNGQYIGDGLYGISSGINNIAGAVNNSNSLSANRNTFDLLAAANYLGITEVQLSHIVSSTGSGIPYVKIGDQYIFSKSALDKWLETARLEMK